MELGVCKNDIFAHRVERKRESKKKRKKNVMTWKMEDDRWRRGESANYRLRVSNKDLGLRPSLKLTGWENRRGAR